MIATRAAGLKAALDKGAAAAVESLGRTDGFWANPRVKIPLPDHLQRTRSAIKLMGKGQEVDALGLAVNRCRASGSAGKSIADQRREVDERRFRANPLAAGSDIIRRLFGALN